MKQYNVLKGKDGFMKEEELEYETNYPKLSIRVRTYDYSPLPTIRNPWADPVLYTNDREFHLKSHFKALGKHICYYEEK